MTYTSIKEITVGQYAEAAIAAGALFLTTPALKIDDPVSAVAALDDLIVWMRDVREYIENNFISTPVFSSATRPALETLPVGFERAFPASRIVEAKQGALRSLAIMEVRAITEAGLLFTRSADELRWNDELATAQIRAGGEWFSLTRMGLEWATEEGFNILNPDRTVTLCVDALPEGGGGGELTCPDCGSSEVSPVRRYDYFPRRTEYACTCGYHFVEPTSPGGVRTLGTDQIIRDEQGNELADARFGVIRESLGRLARGDDRKMGGGGGGGGEPYTQFKTLIQLLAPTSLKNGDQEIEDHLNDGWWITNISYSPHSQNRYVSLQRDYEISEGGGGGWRSDEDAIAANLPGAGNSSPLYKMTAKEARQYTRAARDHIQQLLEDLSNIPGVKIEGQVRIVIEVSDEDGGAA